MAFGISGQKNVGAFIKVVKGIDPVNAGAGAINGPAIDRQEFNSAVLKVSCGAAAGGPSAQTVDGKLQDSADGTTGWGDLAGAAVAQLTADNAEGQVNVDLSGAKRYIRTVATVAFTGGTTPAIPVAAEVVLGGATELPV
jgi:hypothetical protein